MGRRAVAVIVIMSGTSPRSFTAYMITSGGDESRVLAAVARALELGVDLVQVRRPLATGRSLEKFVERCVRISPRARERLIVNDRLDVALAAGVKGVHLPAAGLPVAEVRRHVPEGFCIGVSTHARDEILRAAEAGADFAVFGPVFATPSKPGHPGVGLDALSEAARRSPIPVFALGGVRPEAVGDILETGARGVAGISSFEDAARLQTLLAMLSGRRGG